MNDCPLQEDGEQNSQSGFEQLIEFKSVSAVNTAGDSQRQHEQKST